MQQACRRHRRGAGSPLTLDGCSSAATCNPRSRAAQRPSPRCSRRPPQPCTSRRTTEGSSWSSSLGRTPQQLLNLWRTPRSRWRWAKHARWWNSCQPASRRKASSRAAPRTWSSMQVCGPALPQPWRRALRGTGRHACRLTTSRGVLWSAGGAVWASAFCPLGTTAAQQAPPQQQAPVVDEGPSRAGTAATGSAGAAGARSKARKTAAGQTAAATAGQGAGDAIADRSALSYRRRSTGAHAQRAEAARTPALARPHARAGGPPAPCAGVEAPPAPWGASARRRRRAPSCWPWPCTPRGSPGTSSTPRTKGLGRCR